MEKNKEKRLGFFKRLFGHLRTVHKHRKTVKKLCFRCGLYKQGLAHDLSKYSWVEFSNGVKFYTGTASPHLGERKAYGYSKAWLHHKGHNKHHADYWIDISGNGIGTTPVDMPLNYLVEMFCDRVAASMIYLKDKYTDSAPWDYYCTHRDENEMSDLTRILLEKYLITLKIYGLDKTIKQIRLDLRINKKH